MSSLEKMEEALHKDLESLGARRWGYEREILSLMEAQMSRMITSYEMSAARGNLNEFKHWLDLNESDFARLEQMDPRMPQAEYIATTALAVIEKHKKESLTVIARKEKEFQDAERRQADAEAELHGAKLIQALKMRTDVECPPTIDQMGSIVRIEAGWINRLSQSFPQERMRDFWDAVAEEPKAVYRDLLQVELALPNMFGAQKANLFDRPLLDILLAPSLQVEMCERITQLKQQLIEELKSWIETTEINHSEDMAFLHLVQSPDWYTNIHSQEDFNELHKYFHRLFQIGDTNDDGVLTPTEFEELLSRSGFNFPAPVIESLLKATDLNDDGVIEYDEFVPLIVDLLKDDPSVLEVSSSQCQALCIQNLRTRRFSMMMVMHVLAAIV